jgi:hypothetical protein
MSNLTYMSFREYKSECSLNLLHEDLFLDTEASKYGCYEDDFLEWLREQRLFIKRFATANAETLNDVRMPERKWGFFSLMYERSKRTAFLINTYPDGFFECIKDGDTDDVACFLPDTYGEKPYRISLYKSNGPTYHDVFNSREEALTYLAQKGYKPCENALERLVGTDRWDRGLQVTRWIQEGIHPTEGLERDKHIPAIARLFPEY